MESTTITVLIVDQMAALLPIVPQMVEVRIRVLYWTGWETKAGLHRKAFGRIVVIVRVLLVVVGTVFATKLVTS